MDQNINDQPEAAAAAAEPVNIYKRGQIYKIVNDLNDEIYIGSTTNKLWARWNQHKNNSKQADRTSKIYKAMRELGVEHFRIVLIEQYSCDSKDELTAREDHHIQLLKPSLNTVNAVFSAEKQKIWYDDYKMTPRFKELKARQDKKFYEENKPRITEYKKQWHESNKERIKAINAEKVRCEFCNVEIARYSKNAHDKSERHKQNLPDYEPDPITFVAPLFDHFESNNIQREHKKQWYEANKQRRKAKDSEKVRCDICNVETSRAAKLRHEKSERHKANLQIQPPIVEKA